MQGRRVGARRLLAAFVVLAFAAVGCSSSTQSGGGRPVASQDPGPVADRDGASPTSAEDDPTTAETPAPGSPTVAADETPASTETASPEQPGTSQPTSTPASASPASPGPPPPPVKLGFAIPSGNSGAAFGVEYSSNADLGRKAIAALVAEVNERGGFGGRPAEHVVVEVDQTDQSSGTQQRLQTEACLALTEDHQVDLAISAGVTSQVHDCFAAHETALLDELVVADAADFRLYQPWLLPPMWLNATRLAKLVPLVMEEADAMSQRIGILSFDNERDRRLMEQVMVPDIEARGGKVLDVAYMPLTYDGAAAGTNNAVLRFNNQDIDTVIVWASLSGVWGLFAQQAESQMYRPAYVVSTYQTPRTAHETGIVPRNQIRNTIGAGFFATLDQSGSALPAISDEERACWEVVNRRSGTNLETREDGDPVTGLCDAVFLTEAALARAAGQPLPRADVPGHFHALGGGYDPIRFDSVFLSDEVLDALGSYSTFAFDAEGCDCFAYQHGFRPIPFRN